MSARLLWLVPLVLAVPAASAQMLPSGTWTGTLTDADGERYAVEAALERCAAGFTLAVTVDGRTAEVPESAPATWQRGRLRFATSRLRLPGTLIPRPLVCDLQSGEEGVLGGTCTSGRTRVRLDLTPPPDASFGCE